MNSKTWLCIEARHAVICPQHTNQWPLAFRRLWAKRRWLRVKTVEFASPFSPISFANVSLASSANAVKNVNILFPSIKLSCWLCRTSWRYLRCRFDQIFDDFDDLFPIWVIWKKYMNLIDPSSKISYSLTLNIELQKVLKNSAAWNPKCLLKKFMPFFLKKAWNPKFGNI